MGGRLRSRSRSRSRGRSRQSGPGVPAIIREALPHRVAGRTDPTAGAPEVDYAANPWVTYAELVDVFTPPQLDESGNPIKPEQKEWREDPRSVKGWTEAQASAASVASAEAEFKL